MGELVGNLQTDPHVWAKAGNSRVVLPLNPAWFTTDSAVVTFQSGHVLLGGFGILRGLSRERALVSPIALGLPLTAENAWFYRDD